MSRGVSEEAPELVSGPCLRHRRFRSGKLHMVGRVPGEDPLADGSLKALCGAAWVFLTVAGARPRPDSAP